MLTSLSEARFCFLSVPEPSRVLYHRFFEKSSTFFYAVVLVRNFNKDIWEANCRQIVKTANDAKFSQNPELLKFLLNTRGRILVEASPRDQIWGIGIGKNNPNAENPINWRGRNLLGFALTEVRDEIITRMGVAPE